MKLIFVVIITLKQFCLKLILYAYLGIDIALWDLLGKILGVPVCELLGGAARSTFLGRGGGWTLHGYRTPLWQWKKILQFLSIICGFLISRIMQKNILYKRISKHIDVKNERNKMCYDRTRWLRSNSMRNLLPPFVPHILIHPINLQYGLHVQNLFDLGFCV